MSPQIVSSNRNRIIMVQHGDSMEIDNKHWASQHIPKHSENHSGSLSRKSQLSVLKCIYVPFKMRDEGDGWKKILAIFQKKTQYDLAKHICRITTSLLIATSKEIMSQTGRCSSRQTQRMLKSLFKGILKLYIFKNNNNHSLCFLHMA